MIEVNNRKRTLIFGIVICLIIFLSLGGYFYYSNKETNDKNNKEDVKPSLKDDFYGNINYETLKNVTIPSDYGEWSKAYDAQKKVEERQEELVDEILADPDYKNEKIDIILELFNDYETRNKNGYTELQPYFDMIDEATTIKEFNKVSLTLKLD